MKFFAHLSTLMLSVLATAPCIAFPIQVIHQDDLSSCDTLIMPFDADELGSIVAPFPPDELIAHAALPQQNRPVCQANDDPSVLDAIVEIENLTNRTFSELWYVADLETTISNVDGFADDVIANVSPPLAQAFRIDDASYDAGGSHHPLLSESIPGGGFEPGDTWRFVLQDYSNVLGLAPDAFASFNVGSASGNFSGTTSLSSGSIVAIVPEPSCLGLLGCASVLLLRRRHN